MIKSYYVFMMNNNFYKLDENSLKMADAVKLLEDLLNSRRCHDVMQEIENIKLSNVR